MTSYFGVARPFWNAKELRYSDLRFMKYVNSVLVPEIAKVIRPPVFAGKI